jgi:hypothetical protein
MNGIPTHGDSGPPGTSLYNAWRNMNRRCDNVNAPQYKDWGGRGIAVCEEWKNDYVAFRSWALNNGYCEGLCLDREDNDGNYTPDNCRWVQHKRNSRNRRNNRIISAFGEEKTLADWVDDPRCKVKYATLFYRLKRGLPAEVSITAGLHQ